MERAQRFILLYNQLSEHLERLTGQNTGLGFVRLAQLASEHNPALRPVLFDLQDFAQLRNAIVHDRDYPLKIIAEPSAEALERFSQIVQQVLSPQRLEIFAKPLRCFASGESLRAALLYMRDHGYAQVVVQERRAQSGPQLSLLTSEGVARWLAAAADAAPLDLDSVSIAQALACERPGSFRLMAQSGTVYDAQTAFLDAVQRQSRRLFGIIITRTGSPAEKPLGIVTARDLLDIGLNPLRG